MRPCAILPGVRSRILILAAALAALSAAPAARGEGDSAPHAQAGPRAAAASAATVRRARRLLAGRMFTRFTGSLISGNSYDQRVHLCRNGRFIYDTVSYLPEVGSSVSRVRGRWRVLSASFGRRVWRATVRSYPDGGGRTTLTLRYDGRELRVGTALWYAERSDLC
jgi:hypothetical protein